METGLAMAVGDSRGAEAARKRR